MKIRIKDNSVRFRITLKELEQLNAEKRVESITETYDDSGELSGAFRYSILAHSGDSDTSCVIQPGSIAVHLSAADVQQLNDPAREGVYLRREVKLPAGKIHRFMAFVEKDRPPVHCEKVEAWVYEEPVGEPPVTRPIGERV